jgi:hypothetical protein
MPSAYDVDVSEVEVIITYTPAAAGPDITANVGATTSELPLLTAQGTHSDFANGSPSLPLLTASGSGYLWPRVYLNTSASKSGATEMVVTAANAAGTSITFDDAAGAPTGSIFCGVERQGDDAIAWHAVTVSVTADVTANVGATTSELPLLTASGTSRTIKTSDGSPSLPLLTAQGTSRTIKTAAGAAVLPLIAAAGVTAFTGTGAPDLPLLEASGTATRLVTANVNESNLPLLTASGQSVVIKTGDGSPSLPLITAQGTSVLERSATGAPDLPLLEASGTGSIAGTISANGSPDLPLIEASGTGFLTRFGDGSPTLPLLTAAGVSEVIKTATGSPDLPLLEASGTSEIEKTASGSPDLPLITASGASTVIKTATGAPQLPLLEADGTGSVGGTVSATGSPDLPLLTASGVATRTIKGDGTPSLPLITADGTVPSGADQTGTGSPSLPLITASGSSYLWPRVYLNTTQTLVGAEEMNVVAATSDGTSITFHDPIESPGISGSVWLAVENQSTDGIAWHAVTVTATTADVTANSAGTLPLLTASGVETTSFLAPDVYVTGGAANIDLPEVTTSGSGQSRPIHGDGTPELPLITSSGASVGTRSGTGSPELPLLEASGGVFPPFANGAVVLPLLQARGTALGGDVIPVRDTHYASVLMNGRAMESARFTPDAVYFSVQVQDDHFANAPIGGDSFAQVRMQKT